MPSGGTWTLGTLSTPQPPTAQTRGKRGESAPAFGGGEPAGREERMNTRPFWQLQSDLQELLASLCLSSCLQGRVLNSHPEPGSCPGDGIELRQGGPSNEEKHSSRQAWCSVRQGPAARPGGTAYARDCSTAPCATAVDLYILSFNLHVFVCR